MMDRAKFLMISIGIALNLTLLAGTTQPDLASRGEG
jgi:hypothetical protein